MKIDTPQNIEPSLDSKPIARSTVPTFHLQHIYLLTMYILQNESIA